MIGPASSFYDPNASQNLASSQPPGQDEERYRQWVESYNQPHYNSQYQYSYNDAPYSHNDMYGYYNMYQQPQQPAYNETQHQAPPSQSADPPPVVKPTKRSVKKKPQRSSSPQPPKAIGKRKRVKKTPEEDRTESDSEDDDLGGGISIGMGGFGVESSVQRGSRLYAVFILHCTHTDCGLFFFFSCDLFGFASFFF